MSRVQVLSVVACLAFLGWMFQLMRSRRLKEQDALVWLATGLLLLAFALKRDLIDQFGRAVGIAYSPTALLIVLVLLLMAILLHFSTVTSTLTDRTVRLAQELALLRHDVEDAGPRADSQNESVVDQE